jgi:hypothetical protein
MHACPPTRNTKDVPSINAPLRAVLLKRRKTAKLRSFGSTNPKLQRNKFKGKHSVPPYFQFSKIPPSETSMHHTENEL